MMMKRYSTIILRCAVVIAGIVAVAMIGAMTLLVIIATKRPAEHPLLLGSMLAVVYVSAIPYFTALYQAFRLLYNIDANQAFSQASVKALQMIARCAVAICIIYMVGGLPFFYYLAQLDDAPGVMLLGLGIAGIAFVIAVFASVLNRLLQEAIAMKSFNELTI